MRTFSTTCHIEAPSAKVWSILMDLARWPEWNTTVPRVEGKLAAGGRITVYSSASPGRAFPITVSVLIPTTRMVWTGGMPLGLFKGQRSFSLQEPAPGQTMFTMTEVFSGLLAPLIVRSLPDLQPYFDEFAASLKRTAEGGSATP